MLHTLENTTKKKPIYWSNSCGDLYYNGEYDISNVKDLPKQLQRAFTDLWCEDKYGVNCYLVEFDYKYGIAFEAGYDNGYARNLGLSYDELVELANANAIKCSEKYPELDVIFGKDSLEWSDGTIDTIVMVVMPYDISKNKFDEIGRYFGNICYQM